MRGSLPVEAEELPGDSARAAKAQSERTEHHEAGERDHKDSSAVDGRRSANGRSAVRDHLNARN